MTDIGYTLTVIAELASHRASTRLFTSDDARAILDHIAAQDQRIADLTAERDAALACNSCRRKREGYRYE